MEEQYPVLCSLKPLQSKFKKFQNIAISSEDFKLGRERHNSVIIPHVCISRDHCIFKKTGDDWILEDCSSFGIEVNGSKLGKGQKRKLYNQDIILLESSNEFVYKFVYASSENSTPCKRRKLDLLDDNHDIIDNVKKKFEQSQSCKIQHIEDKIQNAKHMLTTSTQLKEQVQLDLNREVQQLHSVYAIQIENLKGEKNEVEQQKALLIEERDLQLAAIKAEKESKITALMEQITKHNETESKLIQENNSLKEKLLKERDEFLADLNRESSSKQEMQEMLDRLEAKFREQEEVRQNEKKEFEETLRRETEELRLAKEKEQEEKEQLQEELNSIKKLRENEKREAEQLLMQQQEQQKKVNDEDKLKINQLTEERDEIEKKLALAQADAEEHVKKREIELSALAADRIQQQADQSSEVISSLQEQLERVRAQLQSIETEKEKKPEGSMSADVEDIIETELQCSICSELFIRAITLGCSHTFCRYCIDKWKKNKKECPICRAPILSECKSVVLDSLIDRMMQTSEETKQKRQEILKAREELETQEMRDCAGTSRGSNSDDDSSASSESVHSEDSWPEERYGDEDYGDDDPYEYDWGPADDYDHPLDVFFGRGGRFFRNYNGTFTSSSDSDSGSDGDESGAATSAASASDAVPAPAGQSAAAGVPGGADAERAAGPAPRRRRRVVPGLPGSYYGGYGRCFRCNARGHWAPGCPER